MSDEKKKNMSVRLPYMVLGAIMVGVLLSGCADLREPSKLSPNRIQVQEEILRERVAVSALDGGLMESLATHYSKHGAGPLDLSVHYDPQSLKNGATKANNTANQLAARMRDQGIEHVNVVILPVVGMGPDMVAEISYTMYRALAPKDCEMMSGMTDMNIRVDADYKMGCTIDTVLARQIARPKDLKGQGPTYTTHDGRRVSNSIEGYRSGVPNEPLTGESASGGE